MKVAFFRIKKWEKSILKNGLKQDKISLYEDPLTNKSVKKAKGSEILSVFAFDKVSKKILDQLPKLKMITTRSTGFDHIDLKECKRRNILVMNVPTYGENTVAEHTFALILALSRKVYKSHLRRLKNDFSTNGLKGFDLKGKTLGVVGAGHIGKHVIRIGRGFEMNVLAYDRHPDSFLAEEMNFTYTPFNKLLKKSDIVSLHVPYNKENHHMINKETFKIMKEGSFFINTARGDLVDTTALIWALNKKILAGAGLDVIEGEELIREEKQLLHDKKKVKALEQLAENHELLKKDNVVFTPHIAFYSQEALLRIIEKTIENILDFKKGDIKNGAVGS
jgi:D-lactate dehydrogenase